MRDWLEDAVCRNFVVDCSAVPYLDSTGLAFVVGVYNLASRSGGRGNHRPISPAQTELLSMLRPA